MKTRSQAGKACADGRVVVNGQVSRASRLVRVGDVVRFVDPLGRREEEVRILETPERPLSRAMAHECYERISERALPGPWDGPEDGIAR